METETPALCSETVYYGDVCLRKSRRKRQKKLLVLLFLDFAKNTTLHGLRYVTEAGLHIVEKIFWLITFFASIGISFYFIFNVWDKWRTSPVIVSFDAKHISVDDVPFPSVTICPQTKFLQSTFNFSRVKAEYKNKTYDPDDVAKGNVLGILCFPNLMINESLFDDQNFFLDDYDVRMLQNVSVDYQKIFYSYLWAHSFDNEDELFSKVLTKDGICYNFNGLRKEDLLNDIVQDKYQYIFTKEKKKHWDMKNSYTTKSRNVFPYRGLKNMDQPYIGLILTSLEDRKDILCNGIYSGYKIYLHHPADYPQAMLYHFAALPMQLTSMGIKFTMETAHSSLKDYPIETRQCFFPEDRPLLYYKEYTYSNCMLECLTNYTYKTCNCVGYYMPFHNSSKICSAGHSYCILSAEINYTNPENPDAKECNCLPACSSIQYDAEIHKTDFKMDAFIDAYLNGNEKKAFHINADKYSKVDLFFKQPTFRTVHRSVLFGLSDFLGNCGGLLGLFLGFSWLSLVEIFYFLTFRVFKTIRNDLKTEKRTVEKCKTEKLHTT